MTVTTGAEQMTCGWCEIGDELVPATHIGTVRNIKGGLDEIGACVHHLPALRGEFGEDLLRVLNINTESDMDETATISGDERVRATHEITARFGSGDVGQVLDDLGFKAVRSEEAAAKLWDGWSFDRIAGARRPTAEVTRCSWALGWESVGTVNESGWKVGGWSVRVLMDPLDRDTKQTGGRVNARLQRPQAIVMVAWEVAAEARTVQERRNGIPQFETLTTGAKVPKMVFDLDRRGRPWVDHTYDCFMHRTLVAPSPEQAYEAALVMAEEVGRAIQEHYDERTGYNASAAGEDVVDDRAEVVDTVDLMGEL